jgi:TonB family protein
MNRPLVLLLLAAWWPAAFGADGAAPAAAPASASAPLAAASSAAPPPVTETEELVIYAGSARYPKALADTGAHGEVAVLATLGIEGRPTDVAVVASSHSPALDEAALAYVRTLGFGRPAGSKEAALSSVRVPVRFLKDSVRTLNAKTCADLDVDVAWFRQAFPDRPTSAMDVINMTRGVLFTTSFSRLSTDRRKGWVKAMSAGLEDAVVVCAEHPERLFLEVAQRAVERAVDAR